MTAQLEKTMVTFERLISACRETKEGFRRAAAAAEDNSIRRLLNLYAQQRTRFAEELFQEIYGPVGHRGAETRRDQESAATPEDEKDGANATDFELLRQCLQFDTRALQSYKDALGARIPTRAHFLVSAQYSLMQKAHDRMEGLLADTASTPVEPSLHRFSAVL